MQRKSSAEAPAIVIPVVVEEVVVGTKPRHERVRVKKSVRTREELIEANLQREEVNVTRVPLDRRIDVVPEVRVEGDTTIIPVVEEIVVVEKRLVLKEEIRVQKRRLIDHQQHRVPVRAEEVEVERIDSKDTHKTERKP